MVHVAPLLRSRLGVPPWGRPTGSHRSVCLPQAGGRWQVDPYHGTYTRPSARTRRGLPQAWAAEYSPRGVRVNTVAAGPMYTPPAAPELFDSLAATTAAQPRHLTNNLP